MQDRLPMAMYKVLGSLSSHILVIMLWLSRPLSLSICKGGGALCAGNAVALLVFGPVMP